MRGAGLIYPALHRLGRDGLLVSSLQEVDGRERRVYRLARSGRSALAARRSDWSRFSAAVTAVLGSASA